MEQYDVSLTEIKKFVSVDDEKSGMFKIDDVQFRYEGQYDQELIKSYYQKIKSLLPSSLKPLLYGTVQIKDKFKQDNVLGDYSDAEDVIRTGGNENQFIPIFIHELAHRWVNRFASKKQLKQFKELYDNANGKHLVLNKGDLIKFKNSDEELKYEGKALGSLMFKDNSGNTHLYKLIATRSIETINGQKVDKIYFPNRYSSTKFSQFVPVCMEYAYSNKSMDEKLKQKIKEIVEQ